MLRHSADRRKPPHGASASTRIANRCAAATSPSPWGGSAALAAGEGQDARRTFHVAIPIAPPLAVLDPPGGRVKRNANGFDIRKNKSRHRPAFTLLEVVISLGLSVLLVSAIYAALNTYIQVSQEGFTVIERSRVARSLFRQMSRDIQSVLFRIEEENDESDDETDDESADSEDGSTEVIAVINPESALQNASVGLIGDAQKLTLHINRPARDTNYEVLTEAAGLDVRTSDLQSITYFLATASGSGLEGAVGQRALQESGAPLTDSGPQGLARLAGDRMAIDQADLESDIDSLAAAAQLLAPEVVSMQFRYFDGLSWQTEWDSVVAQRLPNAVEVTIGMKRLVSEEERLALQFDPAARSELDEIVETRRHVVALPLAEPFTEGL